MLSKMMVNPMLKRLLIEYDGIHKSASFGALYTAYHRIKTVEMELARAQGRISA